jgi:hypothetical protein
MLIAAVGFTAVAFTAMAVRHDLIWLGAWLFADGFLLMASLPVVLDWSELHAGPERQGEATGFLLMAGNLGGLVLIAIDQALIGNPYLALAALGAVGLLGLPLAFRLPARASLVSAQHAPLPASRGGS